MWRVLSGGVGQNVLMIGHNPGIAEFAGRLVMTKPDHPRFWDYPTGATLVVTFDVATWSDAGIGTGKVMHFVIPRELME